MVKIIENYSLAQYNTFGVEVRARYFAEINSIEDLQEVLVQQPSNILVLGGGSNILFTGDFDGWVLKNNILGKRIIKEDIWDTFVEVGSGENWHEFVIWCLKNDLGGVENLALIPGTVGAAPIQNIGAYGVELENVFWYLEAVELATGKLVKFDENCEFGYRNSIFKQELKGQFFITTVAFQLTRNTHHLHTEYGAINKTLAELDIKPKNIQNISKAVIHIRSNKLPDPKTLGNAGSFFKNPIVSATVFNQLKTRFPNIPNYPQEDGTIKLAAGWLIDQCGWKGKRIGNVGAYQKQALVLVNYGEATGKEILHFSQAIQSSVQEKFGLLLEPEVNIL